MIITSVNGFVFHLVQDWGCVDLLRNCNYIYNLYDKFIYMEPSKVKHNISAFKVFDMANPWSLYFAVFKLKTPWWTFHVSVWSNKKS